MKIIKTIQKQKGFSIIDVATGLAILAVAVAGVVGLSAGGTPFFLNLKIEKTESSHE
jgi:ubiquinone/menaquinone biosynthesis C-methylase UbiE